ncbi:hypothetical protein TNCV_279501 [Trichonephila clavipes]|nr:hypothetical protein TNCV_279501 [Trichonephila clavipes]
MLTKFELCQFKSTESDRFFFVIHPPSPSYESISVKPALSESLPSERNMLTKFQVCSLIDRQRKSKPPSQPTLKVGSTQDSLLMDLYSTKETCLPNFKSVGLIVPDNTR